MEDNNIPNNDMNTGDNSGNQNAGNQNGGQGANQNAAQNPTGGQDGNQGAKMSTLLGNTPTVYDFTNSIPEGSTLDEESAKAFESLWRPYPSHGNQ